MNIFKNNSKEKEMISKNKYEMDIFELNKKMDKIILQNKKLVKKINILENEKINKNLANNVNIQLHKLNIKTIHDSSNILIIGKKIDDTSGLIKNILHSKKDIPTGFVISPYSVDFYSEFISNLSINDVYSHELLSNFIEHQIKIMKMKRKIPEIDKRSVLVLDNCLDNKIISCDNNNMTRIMFNGEIYQMLRIINFCYINMPPSFRNNFDYIFLFQETDINKCRRIYEQYGGMFSSFNAFNKTFEKCTENSGCLVINQRTRSNKLEDQVFWYRVEDVGEFKMF